MRAPGPPDHLLDYREQGKRAYYIASTISNDAERDETEVLERLSHEFELCAYGLGEVRANGNGATRRRGRPPRAVAD